MTAIVAIHNLKMSDGKAISCVFGDTVVSSISEAEEGYNKVFTATSIFGNKYIFGIAGNPTGFQEFATDNLLNKLANSSSTVRDFALNLVEAIRSYNKNNTESLMVALNSLAFIIVGKDGMIQIDLGGAIFDKVKQDTLINGGFTMFELGSGADALYHFTLQNLGSNFEEDSSNNISIQNIESLYSIAKKSMQETSEIDDDIGSDVILRYIEHEVVGPKKLENVLSASLKTSSVKKSKIVVGTTAKNYKLSDKKVMRYSLDMLAAMKDTISKENIDALYSHSTRDLYGNLLEEPKKIGYITNPSIKNKIIKSGKKIYELQADMYINTEENEFNKLLHNSIVKNKARFKISAGLVLSEFADCVNRVSNEEYVMWNDGKINEVAIIDTKYEQPFDQNCEIVDIAASNSISFDTEVHNISSQENLDFQKNESKSIENNSITEDMSNNKENNNIQDIEAIKAIIAQQVEQQVGGIDVAVKKVIDEIEAKKNEELEKKRLAELELENIELRNKIQSKDEEFKKQESDYISKINEISSESIEKDAVISELAEHVKKFIGVDDNASENTDTL